MSQAGLTGLTNAGGVESGLYTEDMGGSSSDDRAMSDGSSAGDDDGGSGFERWARFPELFIL